jgi:hypothetical protein
MSVSGSLREQKHEKRRTAKQRGREAQRVRADEEEE